MPLPLSTKVTPGGSAPVSDRAAAGFPLDPTVNVPAVPAVKVVLGPEVMLGASGPLLTVSVKDCEASGLIAVGRGDRDREGALGAFGRRPRQGGGAVAVVDQGHAVRERPRL